MKIHWLPASALALAAGLALTPLSAQAQARTASTRVLSVYHRDDAMPGNVTHVSLDAQRVGTTPLSPFIFGNFLEHLGDVVYHTLWADTIMNPDLERGTPQQTEPPYWDQTGAAAWLENNAGYDSPSCERLSAPDGEVGELTYLPIQRIRRYTLTLFLRAPAGPSQVTVELHEGQDRYGRMLEQTALSVSGSDWQKQTVHWTLAPGALPVGQQVRFVVAYQSGGPVDVDQVHLFPDDAVDGMDPTVVQLAKDWHIPILRQAGNFESQYHWQDGVGPPDARPTRPNLAWGGIDSNQFGTDEFLDLCHLIGAVPQIGANAGNGTPEEAAAWVRYCNAKTEQVPIWEIGNELYGGWQIGHTDAPGNAARFVAFRDAMRAVDPRIKLIATGRGDEFSPDGLARDRVWNLTLLHAALANGGQAPNWLSIHPLVALPGGLANAPYEQRWQSAMAQPIFMDETEIPQLEDEITSVEGPNALTRIAPTEWGIIVGGPAWRDGPTHNAESGAIFDALTLNAFLRNGDWVTLANATALLHGGCIAKDHGVPFVMPAYYTSQLYAEASPRIPIGTITRGPGEDVPQRGGMPAAANVPDIDVFSALTADRNKLVLFAVNRRLNSARPMTLNIAGFPVGLAKATLLASTDPQQGNSWNDPNAVEPRAFPLPSGRPQGAWRVTLPAHSLVVFTFTRKTGGGLR